MDYSQHGNNRRKRSQNPHTMRVRNKIGLLIMRVMFAVVLIGGFAGLGLLLGVYMGILNNAPALDIRALGPISPRALHHAGFTAPGDATFDTPLSSFIVTQDGDVIETLHAGHNRELVPFEYIPQHLIYAFVAIEDERFFEHNGIDPRGIVRAMYVTTLPDRAPEGASTITQQLVKNMLRVMDNDFITKLQEQYLAINFERYLVAEFTQLGYSDPQLAAKNFILQSYLNMISLGRQNYGVQAAAWFYYGVCVSELNIAQSATIAAITQNPSRFPPDTRPENNWRRTRLVLRNMHRLGFISDEEFEDAMRQRPVLCHETGDQLYTDDGEPRYIGYVYDTIFRTYGGGTRPMMSEFDCFTDALLDQLRDDLMIEFNLNTEQANHRIFNTGLRIYSTQDIPMQGVVDRAFLNEQLWPREGAGVGFSIEVTHYMTVYNSITQQRRHYWDRRTVDNMAQAEAFIAERHERLLTTADEIVDERIFKLPQPQGAFVIMDHHNGHVKAMRGIRGPKDGNRAFNRATQATRSPGSQMKPLVPFAVLIEVSGMAPSTVIDDIPFTLPNPGGGRAWSPGNHWTGFRGLTTIRNGIYASGNVISARGAADPSIVHAGMPAMTRFLEQMGVTTLAPHDGPAIVLGGMTHGMRLIELAGAYATLANLGEYNRPILYTRVYDHDGRLLLENGNNPQRVFRATTAYLVTHAMMDTVTRGTGGPANWTAGSGLRGQIPIAGKTGTSQSNRDLGFVGYTPYFTAAFWIGNDNEQAMHRRTREFHTPMWRTIMEEIHLLLEKPPRQFTRPAGIVTASVCLDSGHSPSEYCRSDPRGNRVRSEVFAAGNVPSQTCRVHQYFTHCSESGMIAGSNCPYWAVVSRVGLVRAQPIDHIEEGVTDRQWEVPLAVRQGLSCAYCQDGAGQGLVQGDGLPVWDPDSGRWVILPPAGQQQPDVAGGATVTDTPPATDLDLPAWGVHTSPLTPVPVPTPSPTPTPIPSPLPTPDTTWQGLGVTPEAPSLPETQPTDQTDAPSPFLNPFLTP
ncbi:MAG: transglycosylase domain-containing protein [Defluviitaleaceae bacterium]|nr:transglycosylase domain-containing protein [Defluviitaleaceae bacterium]MCL2263197.1 transglycosylase domain-containing protein [Defluviitaleaceae bacterium]